MTDTPEIISVSSSGTLKMGQQVFACALGSGGVVASKTEGDHATPAGCFPLRRVMYRADRIAQPITHLPLRVIQQTDGWCDTPDDPAYNRLISLPSRAHHEELWREDPLYDIIVEVGYNDDPPVPGKGSAIFMHVARRGYASTEGCIALEIKDLLQVLGLCGKQPILKIDAHS